MQSFLIKDIFEAPSINSGITKEFCSKNKGEIPVFASSKNGNDVLGYIDENIEKVKYFNDCLTYNRNGSVGYVFFRKGKFTVNEDARVLILKNNFKDKIHYGYAKYILELILLKSFDYTNKAGINKVLELSIPVPTLTIQKKVINFLTIHNVFSIQANSYIEKLQTNVRLSEKFEKKYFKVSDIFDIKKGNADYTKEYINENIGDYPVYSSQTKDDGVIGKIKHYDYDENCLTWTTDGTYVGTVFLRNGKFSMTSHCGALILKEEYKTLNLEYLQIILSEILPNYKEGEGSNKRLGKQKIADVDMPIPVKKNDEFDLQVQVKIVEEHKKIENLKSVIANKLEKITKSKVNLFE